MRPASTAVWFVVSRLLLTSAAIVLIALVACPGFARAQANQPVAKEPPPPADIELTTKDGVLLKATWWGNIAGNQTPVVMLLHGSHGSRGDFAQYASYLQRER